MTEWTLLKRLLDAVHHHSTMIGRLWLTVMVIFRLLIVAVATEEVYTDEQEMFVCNTLQPGCSTVCYDAFAPISQPRFWVFHIISVSTPSLCFIIYTWHSLSKPPHRRAPYDRSCDSDSCSVPSHKHLGHSLEDVLDHQGGDPAGPRTSGGVLSKCYVLHVCLRALLEVVFVVAQWKLFGFRVPVHFLCRSQPCSQPVDCFVSRPTEKTVFLLFMFAVGVFCVFLNLLELNHLGWKKIRRAARLKEGGAWGGRAARKGGYHPFPSDSPSLTSTASLPALDLVGGQQPDWTCAVSFSSEPPGRPERQRGENSPPKNKKGAQTRSAEVWI
ncbi:gap junction delta-2 protein-like [Oryzias latipes]|uniref:gap junction delta-2 protein-like n=1 Tax=Oryzias latipes TaxID=8090 RepID=UPI000CE18747|nr:gap junction delta-2 protein-like [Oryzias latipes]